MSLRKYVTMFVGLAAGVIVAGAAPSPGLASSHREAPLTAGDPHVDATDLYGFVSPDAPDTVTLVSAWIPFQAPAGGPNFYPWGLGVAYELHIDNNGDAVADITYRWTLKSNYKNLTTFLYNTGPVSNLQDPTLNFTQSYTLERVVGVAAPQVLLADAPVAPSYVGHASMPDYNTLRTQALATFENGAGRSFVGQSDDPFFGDLRLFDLLYGGDLKEVGNDTLAGFNVNAMALQVPKTDLALVGDATANPIVGMWTTASRPALMASNPNGSRTVSGPAVQVSRLGSPLVNEVIVPVGAKDAFNASSPDTDLAALLPAFQNPELPNLMQQIYNLPAPAAPRDDLVSVFLTGVPNLTMPPAVVPSEQLRLNMSIPPAANPNRLGVLGQDNAGYPNGRRLTDDVVDIQLRAMEGALRGVNTDLGDGVDMNDVAFLTTFPYLPLPHSGSAATPLGVSPGAPTVGVPTGGAGTGGGGTAGGDGFPVLPLVVAAAGTVLLAAGLVTRRRLRAATDPAG